MIDRRERQEGLQLHIAVAIALPSWRQGERFLLCSTAQAPCDISRLSTEQSYKTGKQISTSWKPLVNIIRLQQRATANKAASQKCIYTSYIFCPLQIQTLKRKKSLIFCTRSLSLKAACWRSLIKRTFVCILEAYWFVYVMMPWPQAAMEFIPTIIKCITYGSSCLFPVVVFLFLSFNKGVDQICKN